MNKFWKYFTISKAERPHWFIDAKWVCGILALILISSTMTLYSVIQLTDRQRAVEVITLAIEKTLSKAEGNIQNLITDYKNELANQAADQATDQPAPDDRPIAKLLNSFFPESKILTSSPEQLKTELLQNIAVPFYEGGTSAVFTLLRGLDYSKYLDEGLSSLKIYSDETHRQLQTWFGVLLAASLVMLFGVVYFSRRWGKLFSPGMVLLVACAPGYFSFAVSHTFVVNLLPSLATEGANIFMDIFVVAIVQTVEKNMGDISTFPITFFYIGLSLMIAAAAGKIYLVAKKRQAQKKPVAPPAPWPKKG